MRSYHKCLQILFFLLLLLFFYGCAISNVISIRYEPSGEPSFSLPPDKRLNLCLGPITGLDSGLWYRIGADSWALEKSRESIVYEALAEELRRMRITVCENPSHGKDRQGRIEVEIRWFEPYGCYPLSAAVILSLALYPKDAAEPCWRGKFQAGTFYNAAFLTDYVKKVLMQKAASEALYKTVRQLSWNWDFVRALKSLAVDKDLKAGGERRKAS